VAPAAPHEAGVRLVRPAAPPRLGLRPPPARTPQAAAENRLAASRTKGGGRPDTRLNGLWFGDGAGLNRHALQTALAMAA
jgi:hypothetical protein